MTRIGGCILFLDFGIACGRLSGPRARLGCMYCGQVGSLLREVHGYGVWFAAYEGLLGVLQEREQKTRA